VDAAHAAFGEWSRSALGLRRAILLKAAELLLERAPEIAGIVTEETGGVFGWGMFNCELAAGMLREAAAQAYGLVGDVIPSDVPGKLAMGIRAPGRRRRDRPVERSRDPRHAIGCDPARVREHGRAEGVGDLPANARRCGARARGRRPSARRHQLVTNAPEDAAEVVDELIAHPATRRINFTGSTRVGRIIAENAERHLKRVLLELGGKAPMIVLGDADLDRAAAAASFGAFFHQGQICMSTAARWS
jgi:acyl-CoA reductase-like NAD-dependent aldehyde dehydrogenase